MKRSKSGIFCTTEETHEHKDKFRIVQELRKNVEHKTDCYLIMFFYLLCFIKKLHIDTVISPKMCNVTEKLEIQT